VRLQLPLAVLVTLGLTAGIARATVRPVRTADGPLLARQPTYEEKVAEQVADRLTLKHVNVRCGPLGVPGASWPDGVTGITLFKRTGPAGYALVLPEVCAQLISFRSNPNAYNPAGCGDADCLFAVEEAALAIQTLTHESYHLLGYQNEAKVECYGMQSIWYAATKLGASVELGQALAHFYATKMYPQRRTLTPAYWSAQCRDGGKYDLRKDSHSWPS
jgi:hypothetical protein